MEAAVTILVIIFAIMFILGVAASILTFLFNKQKRHPTFSIVMSIALCPMIYIPLTYTIGFTARFIIFLLLPYSIAMIVWAVKKIILARNEDQ